MPLTRYQIRNEYGLADPELYRAADKDDPEALLEGVAMAGLVGVLRQLGDLAEFAAEIFHDLHEEVMATASRGHGLMARVQQLEAEFPSVEKAFLTQTDETPFFTNAGVDWHPNLRMEQNLITRGDLPRFVMESYEECRGPPRLFLLDKFDVAGAGACLKRYTDPSVFKVEAESSGVATVEAQREKKNRKVKKKGVRWRNGETPEVVPTSHAKLHQLFLEERVENGHSDPARLVKLKKRQLNGFPFDLKPGKSYMERFLGTPSPEHKEVHEVSVNSSPLRLTLNNSDETGLEIVEIDTVSPENKSSQGRKNLCSSPIAEEAELKHITPELNDETFSREIVKAPDRNPICRGEADESAYFIHKKEMEYGLAVEEDRETEGSLDGDGSDDFMSEVDNYTDALTTVESETDNEYKPKIDMGFLMVGNHVANSDASEEHLDVRANFFDSQSIGNSSMSDDGKSISRKGRSSFSCSDSLNNLAENMPSDNEGAAKVYNLEDSISEIEGSPMDHPTVHSVNEGNESTALTDIEKHTAGNAAPSVPTVNSTIISSAQTELDEITSNCTEFGSKSSFTDQKGIDLADSSVSHVPSHTLHSDNSLAEDRFVEELDNEDLDVHVSSADLSDLEEEVDDDSVNKVLQTEYLDRNYDRNLVEGKIGSPHSVTSPVFVHEEHQSDCADGVCENDMVGEVHSTRLVILPSKKQPPSSVFPKSNVDSGVTPVSENSEEPVQINSEVSNAITGKLIGSENLTETEATPVLDSIEEHLCSEIAQAEHDLGGAMDPEENPKRYEDISRGINCEQMDACTDKLDVNGEDSILFEHPVTYSDKSGSEPVNLDDHVDAVTSSAKYGVNDASCLPSDSVGSNSSDFVNILDYLGGKELHQNGTDYNGVLPECLMEPEEQKITRQPESASTVLNPSTFESTSDGSLNPEVLDHIHRPHLTYQTESSSCFSDASAVPSSGVSEAMESKPASLNHFKDACEDVTPSPSKASLEHTMELLAGQSYTSALVDLDETNSESLKLEHSHCNISDSRTPEDSLELQLDDTTSKSLDLQSDKTQIASDMSRKICLDDSSNQEALPILVPTAVHVHCDTAIPRNPFDSAFPSFGLVPESSEEMPPLPPLPPMQWRMGKFQPPSLPSQLQRTDHGKGTFLPMQPIIAEDKSQFDSLSVGGEFAHSPDPFSSITSDIQNLQHLSVLESQDNSIQPIPLSSGMSTSVTDESSQLDFLPVEGTETLNRYLNIPIATNERQVGGFFLSGGDPVESSQDTSSTVATVATEPIEHDPVSSCGSQSELLNQVIPESTSEAKESEKSSQNLAVDEQNCLEKPVLPPTTSEDQSHHAVVTVHGQTMWPSTLVLPPTYEIGKPNGSKLPWPRNPLIDAVAAHDKSKLRKVTERVHRQVAPKADERDSLLEQIRTKSFNLKPTAVARPSIQGIQGPKTNLKVAAILEKANAIRQALTGSDEDEDTDSWSDS